MNSPPPLPFPALHASHAGIWAADPDGTTRAVSRGEAVGLVAETPFILLNAPLVSERLGYPELSGLDLLELFAFVHPARFMVPTPMGLARALGLNQADREADTPRLYLAAAQKLLATLGDADWQEREGGWSSAQALLRLRWSWAAPVSRAIEKPQQAEKWLFSRLPEWEEGQQRAQPRQVTLDEDDVLARLDDITGPTGEPRPGQRAYASAAAGVFSPRQRKGAPNLLLAEAGTGIGKTAGYLAPAAQWNKAADGAVWISTYTKALQRQLVGETAKLYPDEASFREGVVVRKGRENYLCLLNLEDALQGGFSGRAAVLAQLVARWAAYSRDGDMIGGDLPGWLTTLFRRNGTVALTDRRGECIYAGCPHFRKCFIERAARASTQADIVIANHALVMVNAARGREQEHRPTRYIFDEGHHLFDAADSMFGSALTARETVELRRWIIGPEGKSRGRRRGLAARLSDVGSYDEEGGTAIVEANDAAAVLPGEGWPQRLSEGQPWGALEQFFHQLRLLVHARDEQSGGDHGYGLESEMADIGGPLIAAAAEAKSALEHIHRPLVKLAGRLEHLLTDPPDWLDGQARARVDGALGSLGWRTDMVAGWIALLDRMGGPADPQFIDWLAVDRVEGREYDFGAHRRWLDPTIPLAELVYRPAHGVLVTSATLKGSEDWAAAEEMTGATHIEGRADKFEAQSPFDYAAQAEVLIVTDVRKGDMPALAAAYARLIEASRGGAIGLFTAIRRLRIVHGHIVDRLAREGLPVFAQHVDPIDTGTLIDIFRDDPHASLLGTDALRDGVDVPGESLRLVIMEGVPWPKPSVLHRARRLAFRQRAMARAEEAGENAPAQSGYDDRVIRARLAQAFGRLIRRASDRGHFVLLSPAVPSRLLSAFPDGTPIRRVTLDEAIATVANGSLGQEIANHVFSPPHS